jgi:outer membrane lipoprotein-sorting protein
MKKILLIAAAFISGMQLYAQDVAALIEKVRVKIETVRDYEASGVMKTNVPFLKVPVADVKVYYKRPDKLKIKNEKGISLVPRGAVSMSLNNLMANKNFTAIPAGADRINGRQVRIIKLIPLDEKSEVVLSTLYIDEAQLLIMKAVTTTRENGTYELAMEYGRFASYALPRKAVFTFNTKEYKLPKGVTFDYDDGTDRKKETAELKSNKGMVEITYTNYIINKGVQDAVFK